MRCRLIGESTSEYDAAHEAFVPPEGNQDQTADLFALGRTMFVAATGWPPGKLDEYALTKDTKCDRQLLRVIQKACQKNKPTDTHQLVR